MILIFCIFFYLFSKNRYCLCPYPSSAFPSYRSAIVPFKYFSIASSPITSRFLIQGSHSRADMEFLTDMLKIRSFFSEVPSSPFSLFPFFGSQIIQRCRRILPRHLIFCQLFLFSLLFLPPIFVFITYHNAPVIHTDEYPPPAIPTIRGAANSLIELTPMI